MRALVQRVTEARVRVDGDVIGEIGPGLCMLVGVTHDDTGDAARKLAEKVWHLRVFDDAQGKMTLSVGEVGGSILVVSQFTLAGDCRKGRRPSFDAVRGRRVSRRGHTLVTE
jgi:D-tyrosyl-tRNA(Tyr) deacylase